MNWCKRNTFQIFSRKISNHAIQTMIMNQSLQSGWVAQLAKTLQSIVFDTEPFSLCSRMRMICYNLLGSVAYFIVRAMRSRSTKWREIPCGATISFVPLNTNITRYVYHK